MKKDTQDRYKLQVGKWGMYVHDTVENRDIDMEEVRDRLNALQQKPAVLEGERKDALQWFIELVRRMDTQVPFNAESTAHIAAISSTLQSPAVEAVTDTFNALEEIIEPYKADDQALYQGMVCGLTLKQQHAIVRARQIIKAKALKIIIDGTGEKK